MYPERFSNLPPYAFPRLRLLLDGIEPGGPVVHMTIGEPKHPFPAWVTDEITTHAADFNRYPTNEGAPVLLDAISGWLKRRFGADVPADQIMALNGTREGLYNAPMALCPETKAGGQPVVLIPNPFYQAYMVAALSVGAEPIFVNTDASTGFLPDFGALPKDVLERTALVYICSPSNPQGGVASADYWRDQIALAEAYDYKIIADECYSEIYRDTAPTGILTVAQEMGVDLNRIVVMHSLSKRSNLPGLRSGFVASGPETIRRLRQQRNYSGTPLPLPIQHASAAVWNDEAHVIENRALYQEKFAIADRIFGNVPGYKAPEAGFFLWLEVEDGEAATLKLWREAGVRVLPGAYLSQDTPSGNPGKKYIRLALVAPAEEAEDAMIKIRDCLFPHVET